MCSSEFQDSAVDRCNLVEFIKKKRRIGGRDGYSKLIVDEEFNIIGF